jgi:tetratricopeptide (TPR) repeat protein
MMRKLALAFTIGILPNLLTVPPIEAVSTCDVVATVQSSKDVNFRPGMRLCRNQSFKKPSSSIWVACIDTRKSFWLQDLKELQNCEVPLTSKSSLRYNEQFFRARGANGQNKPSIMRPYGRFIMTTRPTLEWLSVSGAKSYSITIWGVQRQTFQSLNTKLTPESGMPALSPGQTYTIIVKAISNEKILSKSISALNILSKSQTKSVNDEFQMIDASEINPIEKIYRRLSILTKNQLLDDSIILLERQLSLNPKDPKMYRVLAEVYLESGLLYKSKNAYEKAMELASNLSNIAEYKLAQKGLETVDSLMNESL